MAEAMDAGLLRRNDPVDTGRWFKTLVLSDLYSRRLWGVIDELSADQIRAHVSEATDIFLTAFSSSRPGTDPFV